MRQEKISHRSENPRQEFKKMSFSYVFRFNNGQFLLICWDGDITWMCGTYSDKSQPNLKEIETRWQKEEEDLAKRFPR